MVTNDSGSEHQKKAHKASAKGGDGISAKRIIGVVAVIAGAILVVFNLAGVIFAFIGLVLIYFGLRFAGYELPF